MNQLNGGTGTMRYRGAPLWTAVTVLALVVTLNARVTFAQYMYLDANGDGKGTSDDKVLPGTNTVDIWLQTDTNADGSPAKIPLGESKNLTINSYEFNLRAEGGTVEFGEYTNLQPTMVLPLRVAKSNTEIHIGYAGAEILPPGKYHLGRLVLKVLDGNPSIVLAPISSLHATFHTSFGSMYVGADQDNTLKLTPSKEGRATTEAIGDWTDIGNLAAAISQSQAAALQSKTEGQFQFSARVIASASPSDVSFRVTTTRPGLLKVLLFDVQGRLVRRLADDRSAGRGVHEFRLGAGGSEKVLAAGVYFYRVIATEGNLRGRFVVLK